MFGGLPDKRALVARLILGELLARRGEGPLARPRWTMRPREVTRPEVVEPAAPKADEP